MADNTVKQLSKKLLKVMQAVQCIPKTGFNTFHRYPYVTQADISAALSKALHQAGVFMFSSVTDRTCMPYALRDGKPGFLVTVQLQVTFIDSDSGEHYTATFYGDGTDSGDKAVYKAITGAQKYALMKTFLISTGDQPEPEHSSLPESEETMMARLMQHAKQGTDHLRNHWYHCSRQEKALLRKHIEEFQQMATDVDEIEQQRGGQRC